MRIFLLFLLFCCLFSFALADEVFVSNRPFKGAVYGVGQDVRVSVRDLAESLGLTLQQDGSGWTLGGVPIEVIREYSADWVRLSDLPVELVKVVRSDELSTIDIYRVSSSDIKSAKVGLSGLDGTLIAFVDPLEPKNSGLEETISQLDRSRVVKIIRVNVRDMNSASYLDYSYLFKGTELPYFVILDSHGRKVTSFAGYKSYRELVTSLESNLKP